MYLLRLAVTTASLYLYMRTIPSYVYLACVQAAVEELQATEDLEPQTWDDVEQEAEEEIGMPCVQ
jgi:hypothetical protein